MRTVTFQSVYEGVLRRHGFDPIGDAITQDTARTIAQKIQRRSRKAFRSWQWLEWSNTEERAFRQRWSSTRQFYRVNPDTGDPDELFYIPNATYYQVLLTADADPPAGTLPTNTTFFQPLTPVDTFIDLDQTCDHSIGQMLGVYPVNPRLNGCGLRGLDFRPSEKGIDVCCPSGPTVFISYLLPEPHYVKRPHIPGMTYDAGDRAFQPQDGNVYRSILAGNSTTPPSSAWSVEPVLEVLSHYLEAGAYADCLRDTFKEGDEQVRLQRAQLADAEAEGILEQEIDSLQAQGQRNYYNLARTNRLGWIASQPWVGGAVTTLTDECDADWIFPAAPLPGPDAPSLIYAPEIADISTLHIYASSSLLIYSIIKIRTGQEFRVDLGAANGSDPGQVAPDDYNATTNNKHFTEVT